MSSKEFKDDESAMLFNVWHHWWNRGAELRQWTELTDSSFNRSIRWHNQHFAIVHLDSTFSGKTFSTMDDTLDFVVIDRVEWKYVDRLADLPTTRVIVSNTLGPKTKERLMSVLTPRVDFLSSGAVQIGSQ